MARRAQRDRAEPDHSGEGALRSAGWVVGVEAADRLVNRSLTHRGVHDAARRTSGVTGVLHGKGEAAVGLAAMRGLALAADLLVVSVSSSAVRAWIWRWNASGFSSTRTVRARAYAGGFWWSDSLPTLGW